jgi:hypothetical protein
VDPSTRVFAIYARSKLCGTYSQGFHENSGQNFHPQNLPFSCAADWRRDLHLYRFRFQIIANAFSIVPRGDKSSAELTPTSLGC